MIIDLRALAAETDRKLSEQGFDMSQDSGRFRVLPDMGIEVVVDEVDGVEGSLTLGTFGDWRDAPRFWAGFRGGYSPGTWGDENGVFIAPTETGHPCPVCYLLGGFHDRARHGSRVTT